MTDRELMELAAEAAGIEYCGPQSGTNVSLRDTPYWNPLENDGDALRLAAKLYLWEPIRLAHREVSADVDIYAATRRAIVRAAAEHARIARAQRST